MKARLLGLLYALVGIALAVGLTFGAYVLAGGRDLSRVARATSVENDSLAPEETPSPMPSGDARDEPGEDISGNCDEAEHADDPECSGRGGSGGDDNSGPGSGGGDDNSGSGSDDNSGSGSDNSGSGSDDSGGDNSGSGSDDSGGDNSGSGSDNSGSGGDD